MTVFRRYASFVGYYLTAYRSQTMIVGMLITELDEISKSAVSETGNMIMGNPSTIIANKAIHIYITPPSLLTGKNIEMLCSYYE